MLAHGDDYAPSMVKFLNQYSKQCQDNDERTNEYLEQLFRSFLQAASPLTNDTFINKRNNRFNIALFEAVFAAVCRCPFDEGSTAIPSLDQDQVDTLKEDEEFTAATQKGTTQTANVETRLRRASSILGVGN